MGAPTDESTPAVLYFHHYLHTQVAHPDIPGGRGRRSHVSVKLSSQSFFFQDIVAKSRSFTKRPNTRGFISVYSSHGVHRIGCPVNPARTGERSDSMSNVYVASLRDPVRKPKAGRKGTIAPS